MCLQTTWKEPKVAEEDIKVYKGFRVNFNGNLESIYNTFIWKSNKKYEAELGLKGEDCAFDNRAVRALEKLKSEEEKYLSIDTGFHSALTPDRLDIHFSCVIIECIIPKGSKYFEGLTDLIVSDALIVTENVLVRFTSRVINFQPEEEGDPYIKLE
jgi:hypothetical protein